MNEVSIVITGDNRTGSAFDSATKSTKRYGKSVDELTEHADVSERRLIGLHDSVDGVATIMQGPGKAGIVAYIQGWADLAGGFADFIIPSLGKVGGALKGNAALAEKAGGAHAAASKRMVSATDQVTLATEKAERSSGRFSSALSKISPSALAGGAALAAVGVGIGLLVKHLEDGKKKASDFLDTLASESGAETAADKLKVYVRALGETRDGLKLTNEENFQAITRVRDLKTQLDNQAKASRLLGDASKDLTDQTALAAVEFETMATAVDKVNHKYRDMLGLQLDLKGSQLAYLDAVSSLDEAIQSNGKTLSDNTSKGRANQEAVLGAVEAAVRHRDAQVAAGTAVGTANEAFNKQITALREHAIKAGLSKTAVDKLFASINHLPTQKEIDLRARDEHARSVMESLKKYWATMRFSDKRVGIVVSQNGTAQRVQREIDSITGKAVSILVGSVRGNGPQARGTGGIVGAASGGARGGLVEVGEFGPELVELPYGSRVRPNGSRGTWGGGSGPQTVAVELRVTGDSDDLLVKWLRKQVRLGVISVGAA